MALGVPTAPLSHEEQRFYFHLQLSEKYPYLVRGRLGLEYKI